MKPTQFLLTEEIAQAKRHLAWAKRHESRELMTLYERHIAGAEQLLACYKEREGRQNDEHHENVSYFGV